MRFLAITIIGLILASTEPAHARDPEQVFAGRIVVMKNRLPTQFRSKNDFIAAIQRSKVGELWPDKAGEDKGKWKFEYIAFFLRPLDDLEVTLRFYDVTAGQKRFLAEAPTFVAHRGDRVLGSNMVLTPPEFEPNRRILMTVENRGHVLASTLFNVRGEGPHYSGKVEFTDEETKIKDGQ